MIGSSRPMGLNRNRQLLYAANAMRSAMKRGHLFEVGGVYDMCTAALSELGMESVGSFWIYKR